MEKVKYGIHHQAVFDCPKCKEMIIEDLGESDDADGCEIECSQCGTEFELEGTF
jgi:DNA-directed RNA polymerase subunit M/transcription elongation factor TFIIS